MIDSGENFGESRDTVDVRTYKCSTCTRDAYTIIDLSETEICGLRDVSLSDRGTGGHTHTHQNHNSSTEPTEH